MAGSKGRALGRGLGALLPGAKNVSSIHNDEREVQTLPLSLLQPNDKQPRKSMDEKNLQALAESIRTHGVIQPLVVRKVGEMYNIVAGERRWRAAQIAGLNEVPVCFFNGTDQEVQEISLIENIQREDLSPLEIARAIRELIDIFSLTQEEVAERIGWSRTLLTNKLRLLQLPSSIQKMLEEEDITEGHARTLLGLQSEGHMLVLARRVQKEHLSVRQLELLVKRFKEGSWEESKEKTFCKQKCPAVFEHLAKQYGLQARISGDGDALRLSIRGLSMEQIEKLGSLLQESAVQLFPGK
ncbi:ParB/RepB/Spo0J family partition protein [Aminobacterium mobile]|uniref:ParB/RepB/Spo0J family partition protein n=1 Tax=Aminobacterium mobile TaxID=81467 RepID=UPI0004634403|nr:ParB/RepB/Spo0J family partition protein [Aminobacterium mobile]